MATIEFFKQQAKNLLKDYNTRVFNEAEGSNEYTPRFFHDIDDLVITFDIKEDGSFTLMNAQHIVSRLAGFYKWNELIKASEERLELGKLLIENRISYQEKSGIITNMVDSLIVDAWRKIEENFDENWDDEARLEAFKVVFLKEERNIPSNPKIILDFSEDFIAQDMISKIMKHKKCTPEKAVLSSITNKNCVTVLATGWACTAVGFWGHDNPYAEPEKLESPLVEIKLNKEKRRLLHIVMEKEDVSLNEAIKCYMIFTLSSLGYHI